MKLEIKMDQAVKKLIRTGQLVPVGNGIYRLSEYVDDLDDYVAKRRSARTKSARAKVSR